MKFNPISRRLFTNDGVIIKQLFCAKRVTAESLIPTADAAKFSCLHCTHPIVDTAQFSDDALRTLLTVQPTTCLKLDFAQPNLTIIPTDAYPTTTH